MPVAESMACGLPVIASRAAGVAELITTGCDGFVLEDSRDSDTLAGVIRQLVAEPALCDRLGEAAAQTARQCNWERNTQQTRELFERTMRFKHAR